MLQTGVQRPRLLQLIQDCSQLLGCFCPFLDS
jgi:hypothetical protein